MLQEGGPLPLHYIFCNEVVIFPRREVEEKVFVIEEYELTFGKTKFFLVIGFQFGECSGSSDFALAFQSCVFPMVNKIDFINLIDGIVMFDASLHRGYSPRMSFISVRDRFQMPNSPSTYEI